MLKKIRHGSLKIQAAVLVGLISGSSAANAQVARNDWSSIANNITDSIEELPGLVSALAYMIGLLMGVLGIIKIKDHVENPTQTPMKEGAVRLAAGGALFGLPIVMESMLTTIGQTNAFVEPAELTRVSLGLRP